MAVDDYTTVPKMGVEKMIDHAVKADYIISNPIEHYSMDEIRQLAKLAHKHDLIFSIKEERSNFYQGIMLNLIKKSRVNEANYFIKHL